jgi:iron complex outermembrane receptor protein
MSKTHRAWLLACASLATLSVHHAAQAQTATQDPPQQTLPPMIVTAPRLEENDGIGPVRGWQALTAQGATRTSVPIEDIPQSITVIPRSMIDDQGSVTLTDALRNAASVTPQFPLHTNQTLLNRIRGFSAEVYRDGLPAFFDMGFGQSLVGIQRIEVLRGPSSALFGGGYGGGGVGGIINIVSAPPLPTDRYEAGFNYGANGFFNPYIDLNQASAVTPDGTQAMVRLGAEYMQGRSYIDNISQNAYQVLPSLTVANDSTRLTVNAFFSERRANDYSGLPYAGTVDTSAFTTPRYLNPNGANVPRAVTQRNGAGLVFEHRIDDTWTARLLGRFTASNLEQDAQYIVGPPVFGSTFAMGDVYVNQDQTQLSVLPMVEGRFTTGPVRHVVLGGFDLDRVAETGGMYAGGGGLFDVLNPMELPYVRPTTPLFTINNTYTTVAAFVQEQATLWDRLNILLTLRWTDLTIGARDAAGNGFTTNTNKFTPRIAASYDIVDWLTVYGGYGTGLRGNPYTIVAGNNPKPEESWQWEAGIRLNLPFGLTGSAAIYEITRTNVPVPDPENPFLSVQTGEQRSRGFELDLMYQPDPRFSAMVSYAYTNAEITKDTVYAPGTPVPYIPRNAIRAFATYRFLDAANPWLRGLSIGAGIYSASGSPLDASALYTRSYTTVDAQIAWQSGPLRIALTGRNLTNTQYFVPYQYVGGTVAPGAPIQALLTASLRF